MKAGFGKVDITPRVGVELCGYGPFLNRHSTRVLEPLYARALAVERDGARWLIVSSDVIAFRPAHVSKIRELICAATGWQAAQVMVHATHTHSGPCTLPELIGWGDLDHPYDEMLPRHVARAGIEAVRDLKPATFAHAEAEARNFSYNREIENPEGGSEDALAGRWVGTTAEHTDTTAHVIRVERNGALAGFVSYFSCHPVVCGARNTEIHGDFVGLATNRVEREHPGAVGLFLQGAQGDINTNYVHGPAARSLVALERWAERFAEVIREGLRASRPIEMDRVAHAESEEPYTLAPIDEAALRAKLAEHEVVLGQADIAASAREVGMACVYTLSLRGTLERLKRGVTLDRPFPVQSFRLGPVSFTAAPFEIMHRIKRRFQAEHGRNALVLAVTNGFLGYAPLKELYHRTPQAYSVAMVPYMLGWTPFTDNIEDEVLAGLRKVAARV